MTRDEAEKIVRRALTEPRPLCDACDGCGWYEGGRELQTECEQCLATGHADAGDVFAALAVLEQKPPEGVAGTMIIETIPGPPEGDHPFRTVDINIKHEKLPQRAGEFHVYHYSHTVTVNPDGSVSDD